MKRVLYLASVLSMCDGKDPSSDSQAERRGMEIFLACICLAASAGAIYLGYLMGKNAEFLGDPTVILQIIFMLSAIVILVLSLVGVLNGLYMTGDLSVVLALPYTANQIVAARLVNLFRLPMMISLVLNLAFGLGYGIKAHAPVTFYAALLCAFICIPVFVICLVSIVVILVMSFVKVLRNRDTIKIIGAIALCAVSIVIIFTNSSRQNLTIRQITDMFSGFTGALPLNLGLGPMLHGEFLIPFLEVIGMTLVLVLIFSILVKTMYLKSALAMADSMAGGKVLDQAGIRKKTAKSSLFATLVTNEIRSTFRDPAFLMNGYIYPVIFPALVIISILMPQDMLSMFRGFVDSIGRAQSTYIICLMIGPLMVICAATSNPLSTSCISREGEDFQMLRQIPVDFRLIVRAKQFAALIVSGGVTTVCSIVFGPVFVNMFGTAFWGVIYMPLLVVSLTLISVNVNMAYDIMNPLLTWENKATMLKNTRSFYSTLLMILEVILSVCAFIPFLLWPNLGNIIGIGILALCLIGAAASQIWLSKCTGQIKNQLGM